MGIETVARISARRYHHCDKREARTEVAGHAATDDEEEDEGADTGEENSGVGIETHQERPQDSRPEHGEYMLQAHKDRLPPGKPLVWRDNTLCLEGPVRKVSLPFDCCHT